MAIKDFSTTENKDLDSEENKNANSIPTEQMVGEAATIKNAHATGDGSYGRSDDSISETDGEEATVDNNY